MTLKEIARRLRMAVLLKTKYRLIACGKGAYIAHHAHIRPNSVVLGHYSFVGPYCWLASKMQIGNFVMLAGQVSAVGGDHRFDVVGTPMIHSGRGENKEIKIADDAWVGHGAILMHGANIGEGAIIAAGSIVTHDIEPYTIAAGIKAKPIRPRFARKEDMLKHQEALATKRQQLEGNL